MALRCIVLRRVGLRGLILRFHMLTKTDQRGGTPLQTTTTLHRSNPCSLALSLLTRTAARAARTSEGKPGSAIMSREDFSSPPSSKSQRGEEGASSYHANGTKSQDVLRTATYIDEHGREIARDSASNDKQKKLPEQSWR